MARGSLLNIDPPCASINQITKHITPAYYGWRDEEDGVLLELEERAFQELKRRRMEEGNPISQETLGEDEDDDILDDYLNVPSQEEVSKMLLEEKKKALLAKFAF